MPLPAPLLDDSKYRTYYQPVPHQTQHLDTITVSDRNTFDKPCGTARRQSFDSGMFVTIPQNLGIIRIQIRTYSTIAINITSASLTGEKV